MMNVTRHLPPLGIVEGLRRVMKQHRKRRDLYGKPCSLALYPAWQIHDYLYYGPLGRYIARTRRIPGWTRDAEAVALAQASYALPENALIVEIGSFLGGSAVLLAGARKLRGSGQVYCIDPFDASGDAFSLSIYRRIKQEARASLRQRFDHNIRSAGLERYVTVCIGRATEVAATWRDAIDLIFLDGDQSYQGVRAAYKSWAPFLKLHGMLAIHNSRNDSDNEDHNGHRRLVEEMIHPPQYAEIRCIGTTTFARKMMDGV